MRAAQQHRAPEVLPGAVVLVPGGGGGHGGAPAVQARPAAAAPATLHHHHAALGRSAVISITHLLARPGYMLAESPTFHHLLCHSPLCVRNVWNQGTQ